MRRKSSRSTSKSTPEKPPDTQRKSRRQSKRQRKSVSRSSSEESDEKHVEEQQVDLEATPTANEEDPEQPVWKVTSSSTPSGEIQKLKFCLTRPIMSPEKEKSGNKHRRNKSGGQMDEDHIASTEKLPRKSRHRGSSGDNVEGCEEEYDHQEDKKGKGKSKTKHKSKSEKTPQIQDIEDNSQSEISENVQVTPQSPQASIDTRVDNDSISTIESETVQTENPETLQLSENSFNECEIEISMEVNSSQEPVLENQSDTPPPILEKHDDTQKLVSEISESEECVKNFEAPQLTNAFGTDEQQNSENVITECVVEVGSVQEEKSESNGVEEDPKMDTTDDLNIEHENEQSTITTVNTDVPSEVPDCKETTSVDHQESDNSSEAPEHLNNDPNNESKHETEKTLSKSMEVDDVQSEGDSVSRDATMDSTLVSFKENTTFEITASLSPDIKQLDEVNQEVQSMKNKAAELLQTPPRATRKWGNSVVGLEMMKDTLQKIDVNTIKEFCPDLQFLDENEVKIDVRERKSSHTREKRKVSVDYKMDDGDYKRLDSQASVNSSEMEESMESDNSNIIAMNRKISIVDDTASKLKPPPSPAKNPVSEILYITNLVRPFTLKQLKELLERTGKIKENGFWTDRIKSKCFAHYESIDESEGTRNALHGVNWPIGNGKKLIIEYATEEEFEKARNPTPPPPVIVPALQPSLEEPKIIDKDVAKEDPKNNYEPEEDGKVSKERQRHRSEGHVREWDIGKENVQKPRHRNKEFDERDDRNDRHKRRRTPTLEDDFISRKEKKKEEEDVPQKLMDDLFRKTKTTPSIYWLPLTPEEIATKQQQRLLRMAEHKRRMEETTRNRGDYGRGAPYRRRYD